MAQPVLVRDASGGWREPAVTSYVNERELQDLVVKSPDLLTGEALATVDEFWIPEIGSVDIIGIAADGSLTIVECKLRANPQIRREVVGQLLAYAGGLWQMPYEQFAATWATRTGKALPEHVQEATGTSHDEASIRQGVTASLASGAFTLVIAVDEITDELKRIIEFLNAATKEDIAVLGLELQYVKEGPTEILIPRTYGEGLKKSAPTTPVNKWTEVRFAQAVEDLDDDERPVVEQLMQHGREHAAYPWWGVGQVPGMSWYYDIAGSKLSLFQIYLRPTGVVVAPSIGGLAAAAGGRDRAIRLLETLRAFEPFAPYLSHVSESELNKYPSIPVKGALAHPGGVDAFLAAIDEARRSM